MKRRNFLINTGLASVAVGFTPYYKIDKIETAQDLQNYLRSLTEVDEPSVDRIVIGDPNTKIKKIGTAWTPYFSTLKEAVKQGVNVMVVHEPTFYTHWDLDKTDSDFYKAPSPAKEQYIEAVNEKRKWIEENMLVIIRSHDVPDILKGFGIPFAFGQALGFTNDDIVASKDYYNVYKIKPDTAGNVAKMIASHLKKFNQPGVAFYGNENKIIETIGLGTGCICNPQQYAELQPDLTIAIDDTIRTWIQTTYSEDTGNPLVVVNHGTTEEMGMRLLSEHLQNNTNEIEVVHFNQGCSYKWITA